MSAMKNIDEDDIYSFDSKSPENIVRSGYTYGANAASQRTAVPSSSYNPNAPARPVTSVRAAGYTSRGKTAVIPGTSIGTSYGKGATVGGVTGSGFDPMNQGTENEKTPEENMEEQIKLLEVKINELVEESCLLQHEGKLQQSLEKAKDAAKKERTLHKQRESVPALQESANLDLTYNVLFNLANVYHANKMYTEALNTYSVIVKNKAFNQSGRLRVNMGNVYFEQKNYGQAIKMYRMALDQIPNTNRDMRMKILLNMGSAFIKLAQYPDAITSFESIMETSPDFSAGFNLLVCYFALGDREKMQRGFQRLVATKIPVIEKFDEGEAILQSATKSNKIAPGHTKGEELIDDQEVFRHDSLRAIARERKKEAEKYISMAAKLIAPVIADDTSIGFDWVIDTLSNSPHAEIASDLEISRSVFFLKAKQFDKAIETLKAFEKKDPKLLGTAATNLSFLYYLDGDLKSAEKYADLAVQSDRYNAKALTNKGNCFLRKGDIEKAKQFYSEAISVDAVCTDALFNLGMVLKRQGKYQESLNCFEKVHSILKTSGDALFQIADTYEKMGNIQMAKEWYNILISVVPTDPGVLARLGEMFARSNDKTQAFQYFSESYRYFPSNMDVISWLGAYYVDCEVYEQAVQFFERAAIIQPQEVKWQLMIASCYRRSGNYQQSFETYKRIHEKFPDNVECLRFLVRICTDLGMKEVHEYVNKLSRAEEKARENPDLVKMIDGRNAQRDSLATMDKENLQRVRGGMGGSSGNVLDGSGNNGKNGGGPIELSEKVDPNYVTGKKTILLTKKLEDEAADWTTDNVDELLPE